MIMNSSPSAKYEIIKEMTSRDNNLLNITWLCEIAGVSRSGYYDWIAAGRTREKKELKDEADFELILIAYKYRGYDKGIRGIHMRLLRFDPPIVMNTKKIRRLMHKFNLYCPIRRANPYRLMSKAMQTSKVAPNILNRQFKAHGARMVLLTDITYIPRRNQNVGNAPKYSYLCVIMDAYTREVLAYVLSLSFEAEFVKEAVEILIENHGNELKTKTLIHSDQGCHYTSYKFIDIINDEHLRQSMSRKANCWDNAPQESLFGHMKDEIKINPSDSHAIIAKKIDDWMDYYNNERYQWTLAKLSPKEFYQYTLTGIYPLPIKPPPLSAFNQAIVEGVVVIDTDKEDS